MKKFITLTVACSLLTACGIPLAKVDKLSSVELADNTQSVAALLDPTESKTQGGLFSGLFKRDPKPESATLSETDAAVSAALGVDATASEAVDTMTVAALAEPKPRGLFGFLRGKEENQPAVDVGTLTAPESATAPILDDTVETALAVAPEKQAVITETVPEAVEKPRRGLFGLLAGARASDKSAPAEPVVQTVSLGGVIAPRSADPLPTPRRKNNRKHKGPDAEIVAFGTRLPSGAVARVCDLPGGRLGKQVEKFPVRGRGYKLIDSNPGSSAPRPFYVTGFDDNCARTFTAALALFGSPTMHEQLRYGLPSKVQPYSLTDKAYEGIKRSVCGVGKNKACGAKINNLEKNTVFISTYDRIGSNASWSNILLHDGWVVAADRKS